MVQLGAAMSPEADREARTLMRAEPRYRWLGERGHVDAMRCLEAAVKARRGVTDAAAERRAIADLIAAPPSQSSVHPHDAIERSGARPSKNGGL